MIGRMTEKENFQAVLKQVLKISKPEMQRRLEEEKRSKTATSSRAPVARAKHG